MKKRFRAGFIFIAMLSVFVPAFAGCSKKADETGKTDTQVTTIKAICNNNYYPLCYLDDDGVLKGYAIDINNLIDEALPQYQYDIETATGDAILLGLESGKYDVALGGFYWNKEREEKFLYPDNFSGGGIVGVMVRKEDGDKVKNLADAVSNGFSFAPTLSGGGIIGVINEYNADNPDQKVEIEQAESVTLAEELQWVLDKRYDVVVDNRHTFNNIVAQEGQEAIKDGIVFNSFTVVKSYDLFNKTEEDFKKAYDEQLAILRENGTLSELSIKWFGEDLFKLVDDGE